MKAIVLGLVPLLFVGGAALARAQHHIPLRDLGPTGRAMPIIEGNSSIRINDVGEVISSPPPLTSSRTSPPPAKPKP